MPTLSSTPDDVRIERPSVTVLPGSAWPQVAPTWRRLAQGSACSIFLTAEWIECWLQVFRNGVRAKILMVNDKHEPIGCSLTVRNRAGLIPVSRMWLNASGESSKDTTYIEYNGVVARLGLEQTVAEAIAEHIAKERWDELNLSGFPEDAIYETFRNGVRAEQLTETRHPAPYVDLAAIRKSGLSYANFHTGKNGKKLRENLRYYSAYGDFKVCVADDVASALEMLTELGALSRKRWDKAAKRSIFCSTKFVEFHRLLIQKCFYLGWIQLIRVMAGEQVIGVVYNFVYRGKVLFYQCGYSYPEDKRLSPGRAALSLVIQHCLDAGHDDFDFLSGEVKYKEWLATGSRTMVWSTLRRKGLRTRVLDALRRIKSMTAAPASERKIS